MRTTTASRLRWWLIRIGILGAVLAGVALAASLALHAYAPALSREGLEAALAAVLGRPVRIEGVTLALWRGRIEIRGLRVDADPAEGPGPLLELGRGRLQVGISSLWKRELVLSTIRLEDLGLRLSATNKAASSPSPPSLPLDVPETLQAGPITVRIGTVRIERGHVTYQDDSRGFGVEVQGLDASARPVRRGVDAILHLAALSFHTADLRETVTDVEASGWIHQDLVTVRKLAARWEGRSVRLTGDVRQPFATAALNLQVQGEVDLAPLAQRVQAPWPLTGVASVDATLRGPVDAVQVAGRLAIPQIAAGPLQARDLAIRGQWGQGVLDLAQVSARVFEGTLRGSVKTRPDRLQETRAAFVLQKASIASLEALALTQLGLRGDVDLEANVEGDPRRLEAARGRFRLAAARLTPPGDLQRFGPGTLTADGTFQNAGALLTQASGRWTGLQFEVSGGLTLQGPSGLRLTLDADLGTVAPLWDVSGFVGRATLKGEASGSWTDPTFAGEVRAAPVTVAGVTLDTLQAPVRIGRTTLTVDAAAASLGRSRATVSGTLTWDEIAGATGAKATPPIRFRADVLAPTVQWEDFHQWLPPAAQGAGRLALAGHVQGTPDAWQAEGTIQAPALSAHDVPIRDLQGAFSMTQKQVELSRFRAQAHGIAVRGTGLWRWDGTGQATADLGPADLTAIPGVPATLGLLGAAGAHVQLAVRSGAIEASGTTTLERVSISQVTLGNGSGEFVLHGGQWRATLALPETRLSAIAQGSLDGDRPVTVRAGAKDVALAPLLDRIEKLRDLKLDGTLTARAEALVPLSQPSQARGTLTLDSARLLAAGDEWTTRGPATLRWEDGALIVDGLHVGSRLGDLKASGRVEPSGPLNLQVEGRVPLTIAPTLRPEIRQAAGTLAIAGRIGGTTAAPRLGGEATIRGGMVQLRDRPEVLREVEARILFSPEGVRLAEATGSLGRGRFRASGELTLDGWKPEAYRILATGTNVSIVPFDGLQTAWDLDLELVGRADRSLLRGEGRLLQGRYTGRLNLVTMLLSQQSQPVADVSPGIPIHIILKLNNNLRVDTNWARLQASGTLSLEGTTARPIVLGSLESQEGRITFRKHRWTLSSAAVRFADQRRIDPILDVTGRALIKDYDVTLHLSGRLDELTFRFSSVPPLKQQELLSLVTLGTTSATGGGALGEVAQLFAEDVLGLATGGYAPETFGVEKNDKNAQVFNVGKQVTEDVRVLYSQTLSGASKRVLRVEYQVIGPLLLAGEQDFQGGFGGDVLIRLRFR